MVLALMTDSILQFDQVDYSYRGDWLQRIHALRDVSLRVPSGASFGYLGANGAGKSTSIKLITGMLFGHTGSIKLFGETIGAPQLRKEIGYLPEHPFFYENLQVEEYFTYLAKLSQLDRVAFKQSLESVYELLDLGDLRKRKLGSFSKGMRQRFGLGQAIIHRPKLLILDEPFSGLDPLWRSRFREVMRLERERGATLFFSSHILSDVEDLCDHYAVIDHGVILEQGQLSDLFEEAPLCLHGKGPVPPGFEVEQFADHWRYSFTDEKRNEIFAQCMEAGVDILRIERPRQALEDYFVERIKSFHGTQQKQDQGVQT